MVIIKAPATAKMAPENLACVLDLLKSSFSNLGFDSVLWRKNRHAKENFEEIKEER